MLEVLGMFSGTMSDGAGFLLEASRASADDLLQAHYWRRAFLARYMHQPLGELDRRPTSELRVYVKIVGDMLRAMASTDAIDTSTG